MKSLAFSIFLALLIAALTSLAHPSTGVLFGCISLCLAVMIIVGWSCAIRGRQFSMFGLIGINDGKAFTVNLSAMERYALLCSATVLSGVIIGTTLLVIFGWV